MTLSIVPGRIIRFSKMTLSIMALGTKILGIMTYSIMIPSIMTFSTYIDTFTVTLRMTTLNIITPSIRHASY